jgi:hypothetical protein
MNKEYTELMRILLRLEGKIDALSLTTDDDKGNELPRVLEPAYALTEGNLMDAGLSQEWVRPIPATVEYIGVPQKWKLQKPLVDCVSTITTGIC